MADAKKTNQTAPKQRRKPAKKTSAAFNRLNNLSASGALSKINSSGSAADDGPATSEDTTPTPTAATATSDVPAPVSVPDDPAADSPATSDESAPTTPSAEPVSVPDDPAADSPATSDESAPTTSAAATADDHDLQQDTAMGGQAEEKEANAAPPTASPTNVLLQGLGQQGPSSEDQSASGREVTLRRAEGPAFPTSSGYSERRMLEALPQHLAEKVQDLPAAYLGLAKSYRQAQATRTGTKPAKRNIRLHTEVATAVNQQMVSDKRMLGLRKLKPSQYVDAALSFAREVPVEDLIQAADHFRDSHLGEESGSSTPNHYSISRDNDDWLDDMMDEFLLANTTGLHGHMINVIVQSFLQQLKEEAPTSAS